MASYIANVEEANCQGVDTELFFADNQNYNPMLFDLCAVCPIVNDCLQYSVENETQFGYWAGAAPKARRRMRRNKKDLTAHLVKLAKRKKELNDNDRQHKQMEPVWNAPMNG